MNVQFPPRLWENTAKFCDSLIGPNAVVIEAKRAVQIPELEAKEREMPEQMIGEVVAVSE
jgi:hypothetical protein